MKKAKILLKLISDIAIFYMLGVIAKDMMARLVLLHVDLGLNTLLTWQHSINEILQIVMLLVASIVSLLVVMWLVFNLLQNEVVDMIAEQLAALEK